SLELKERRLSSRIIKGFCPGRAGSAQSASAMAARGSNPQRARGFAIGHTAGGRYRRDREARLHDLCAGNGSPYRHAALSLRGVNPAPPQTLMQPLAKSNYARGAAYGLAAVCIWAGFIVVSRLGVTTSLTPWDVAAIRFCVAGSLLMPYLLRRGLA